MNTTRVRLGMIGLGVRGRGLLGELLAMRDVDIMAICDEYPDRLETGLHIAKAAGQVQVKGYHSYLELLDCKDIDGVLIATSWTTHTPIAIAAMKAGKYAASEVGGASTLEECWALIETSTATGIPFMILENCCFGRHELALFNMVEQDVFGEIIHVQCGYQHDLRKQVAMGVENRHYRISNYLNRNGEIYPTHGLGPMAKLLGINRGNRLVSVSSISSKSRGINAWAAQHLGTDHPASKTPFAQGDIVTTMLKCFHGETIFMIHDTSLPRPYSRGGRIQGTKGLWMEDNHSIYIEGRSPHHEWESFDTYRNQYEHPLWKAYMRSGIRGGHDGMDYLCLRTYIESIANREAAVIDVFDAALWRSITVLSEQSIALGGAAVPVPDFTNGKWMHRKINLADDFSLDRIDARSPQDEQACT